MGSHKVGCQVTILQDMPFVIWRAYFTHIVKRAFWNWHDIKDDTRANCIILWQDSIHHTHATWQIHQLIHHNSRQALWARIWWVACRSDHISTSSWWRDRPVPWRYAILGMWVFATKDIMACRLSPFRRSMVAEYVLQDFEGMLCTDSWHAWNNVGVKHQVHPTPLQGSIPTKKMNKSTEFAAFWAELYSIPITVITMYTGTPMTRLADQLESKLNVHISISYDDKDCTRYAKRLNREGSHLFTCIRENDKTSQQL